MFGRLRIRGKLALVVALPLVAVALLTLPSVFNAVGGLQRAEEIERSMLVARRVTALAFELQQERLASLGYLFEVVDRGQLLGETARVDDRLTDIRYAADRGELRGGLPQPVSEAVTAAEELVARREAVLDRSVPAEQVFGEYSQVIGELIDSLRLLDGADLATQAVHHVAVLEASLGMNEVSAQATNLLLIVAATGSQQAAFLYALVLQPMGDHLDQYFQYATRDQLLLRDTMEQAYIQRDTTGETTALGFDPFEVTAGQSVAVLFREYQSLMQLGRFVEGKIITDVLAEVASQRQSALRTAYLIALGALLVVLVVVAATAALARTTVRPLLGLTDSANRVARVADAELARITDDESAILMPGPIRLDPVHVQARDEIGDLARAFERVQQFAIRLVERQMISRRNVALMLGYLGRRTQNLVARQLDLIDSLERNETDANRLVDLYRLDHVSSRLRRNAGSLVVLSGDKGSDEYTAPLPLADVARLALGEIEAYERVDIDVPRAIAVVPALISDLVLVLAELMENATTFSPPHTRVTVTAIATGHRGPGDPVVEVMIVDHGIGMPADRMAEENARLARRERLDLAPTEVLGLFVVGRLARRHGLQVTLSDTAGGGVTALVGLSREHLLTGGLLGSARLGGEPSAQPDDQVAALPSERKQVTGSGGFDVEAVHRATRTLAAGQPWNAFAVPPAAPPTSPAAPAPDAPAPSQQPAAASGSGQPVEPPASGPPARWPPMTTPATPAPTAAPVPAETPPPAGTPAPSEEPATANGLRRRVPGASLPSSTPTTRARPGQPTANRRPGHPSSASDPAQARELVEQLQTGVMRALKEISSQDGPAK
jgi:signal transduction histidine kinase